MGKYTEIKKAIREEINLMKDLLYILKSMRVFKNALSDFQGKSYSKTSFEKFFKLDKLITTASSFQFLKDGVQFARKFGQSVDFDDVCRANLFIEYVIEKDGIPASVKNGGSMREILENICFEYKERICAEIKKIIEDFKDSIEEQMAKCSENLKFLEEVDKKISDDRINGEISSDEAIVILSIIQKSPNNPDLLKMMFMLLEMLQSEDDSLKEDTSPKVGEIVETTDDEDENSVDIIKLLDSIKREFERISDELKRIRSYIYVVYEDKEQANTESQSITETINFIKNEYIPEIDSLKDEDNVPETITDWFYERIVEYQDIIKGYRKLRSAHESSEEDIVSVEGTENLLFCMNEDIDLSDSDYQRGYIGAVKNLEAISVDVLCRRSSDNGLGRIKKSTEHGRKEDFVEYLESKYNVSLHFVPYRYHSNSNSRVGIIKFEPSIPVKDFLIKRYGLSSSCAVFGIFEIITVVGGNHNDYSIFESYVFKNFRRIEELASLFSSNTPNLKQLGKIVDTMLADKKSKLEFAKSKLDSGQK